MQDTLKHMLEEKLQERREFRALIEQFRYTNTELYQKMAEAGETRNNVLCNKKAKWKLASVLPQEKNPKLVKAISTLNAKTSKGKSSTIKAKVEPKVVDKAKVEEVLDENDEVVQSLKWACDILLKEHNKRREIRTKRGSVKRKARDKIQGAWAAKYLNEVNKKAKTKKAVDVGIYENMKIPQEVDSKKDDLGALVDDIPKTMLTKSQYEDVESEDEEPVSKGKTTIVNLQKQLASRCKEGKNASRSSGRDWASKTEEEKLNEAKRHLEWLQEKQKKDIIVDFFGVPKTKKESMKVVESKRNDTSLETNDTDTIETKENPSNITESRKLETGNTFSYVLCNLF